MRSDDTMKKAWIDVETTGLDPEKDTIIQLGCLIEDENSILAGFNIYCKPEKKPSNFEDIEKLTGITWKYLEEHGYSETEMISKFTDFLDENKDPDTKYIFCGYNANFDMNFLRKAMPEFRDYFVSAPLDVMSTVATAYAHGVLTSQPSNKLISIASALGVELDPHNAMNDVIATRQIQRILEKSIARAVIGNG